MSLSAILAEHESRTKTLTVFAPESTTDFVDRVDLPGVDVERRPLPENSTGGFVVVSEDDRFLGSVPVAALRTLVSPETVPTPGDQAFPDGPVRRLFELLRDVTFRSFDRRQLLAAAREFEDRAFRVGEGGFHAGFQRLEALRAQSETYAHLGGDTHLDVHVYFDGEGTDPDLPEVTVHAASGTELGDFWFVAFDGGPDPLSACGLLAEERSEGYFGFWTYDSIVVNRLVTHLQETY